MMSLLLVSTEPLEWDWVITFVEEIVSFVASQRAFLEGGNSR